MKTDFISDHPSRERGKLIPWNTPIRRRESVGTYGGGARHLVQVIDLADIDSWRDLEAILNCRFDSARHEPAVLLSPQEALPDLLDFSIDIEQMLTNGDSLQHDPPKGKVLKFELPAHMKAVAPANLVNSSNSTGTAAKVIEFRRR
ncbi:MAG TPA: hypothetical protein VGM27_02065 [Acidobacteriaceae bacterium]